MSKSSSSVSVRLRPDSNVDTGSTHSVCLLEVAPVNSHFYGSDSTWKVPLSIFTNRKQSDSTRGGDCKQVSRRVREYYKAQNKLIEEYELLEEKLFGEVEEEEEMKEESRMNRISLRLSKISFAANFLLLVAKAVAVALSGSISIISSLVDSGVDLLSGVVVWFTSRAVKNSNPYIYPSGRRRLEPMAIVILSVIMSLASFQVIIESVQKIIAFTSDKTGAPKFEVPTIIITACTVVVKLGLFVMCYLMGRKHKALSSSVYVLMQDHRNDILSNSVALICGYLGSQEFVDKTGEENVVYIDPLGAVVIGAYILVSWWQTGVGQ